MTVSIGGLSRKLWMTLVRRFFDLILHCISTSQMRVLWNGEALEEFHLSRGIRQGDPLSLYLFVLCIEKFF